MRLVSARPPLDGGRPRAGRGGAARLGQTVRHRDYFLPVESGGGAGAAAEHRRAPSAGAALASLALLVLLPETLAAVRAAGRAGCRSA